MSVGRIFGSSKLNIKWAVALVVALGSGCGKHPEPAAVQPTEATPPAASQPGDSVTPEAPSGPVSLPSGTAPVVIPGGDMGATLARLTKELHHSIARTHRLPASFEEFVASAHVEAPPAPAGKKYAINSKWKVVLVDR